MAGYGTTVHDYPHMPYKQARIRLLTNLQNTLPADRAPRYVLFVVSILTKRYTVFSYSNDSPHPCGFTRKFQQSVPLHGHHPFSRTGTNSLPC